jgi:hypothetical protein
MAEFSAGEVAGAGADGAAGAETPVEEHADDLAAAAAGERPVLAIGAKGPNVEKLKNLLRVLGHQVAANDELGADCADVVRQAQRELHVDEPIQLEASEIHVGVEGAVVGPATWGALYEAAASKLQS